MVACLYFFGACGFKWIQEFSLSKVVKSGSPLIVHSTIRHLLTWYTRRGPAPLIYEGEYFFSSVLLVEMEKSTIYQFCN